MVSPLKYVFSICALNDVILSAKTKDSYGLTKRVNYKSDFAGKPLISSDQDDYKDGTIKFRGNCSVRAQASICVSRGQRWWEKTLKPNMIEIHSAQQLVDSLQNAGDQLVIVDFYSPACGGCKALHPKICQLAESHPDAIFLKVNHEEMKTMCHSLNIHVLPFFRFYRGSEGRLCSFSCTNTTIKKFKDALVKHGAEECGLGPAKGLDESEIMTLVSVGQLPNNLSLRCRDREERMEELIMTGTELGAVWSKNEIRFGSNQERLVLSMNW